MIINTTEVMQEISRLSNRNVVIESHIKEINDVHKNGYLTINLGYNDGYDFNELFSFNAENMDNIVKCVEEILLKEYDDNLLKIRKLIDIKCTGERVKGDE